MNIKEYISIYCHNNLFSTLKINRALSQNLNIILCVGETKSERDSNMTQQVVENQLKLIIDAIKSNYHNIIIAYEPLWAIGTGHNATPAEVLFFHNL